MLKSLRKNIRDDDVYGKDRCVPVNEILIALKETRICLNNKKGTSDYYNESFYNGAWAAIEELKRKLGKDLMLLDITE